MPFQSRKTQADHEDMPQWARVIKARFGVHSLALDPPAWETVFDEDLSDWTDPEICTVLKWMQSPGQTWKKPDCAKDVVIAVWTWRKDQKRQEFGAPPDCHLCRDGWLDFYPGLDTDGTEDEIFERKMHCQHAQAPCYCPAGNKVMGVHQYKYSEPEALELLEGPRKEAYDQRSELKRKGYE